MKLLALCLAMLAPAALAAADPGKETVGEIEVVVYFGTDADPAVAGERAAGIDKAAADRLRAHEQLRFAHYRRLGSDRQHLFRSYENWAEPIPGSDEILCRFETAGRISPETLRLDIELWISRKKILKSGLALTHGKPVFVLGPAWRGGRLIVSVELAPPPDPGS